MADRKYTVDEIIRMRKAAEFLLSRLAFTMSVAAIEDQLRTYMANGTEPLELDNVATQMLAAEQAVLVPDGFDTRPGAINRVT